MATGTGTDAGAGGFIRVAGEAPVLPAFGTAVALVAEGRDTGGRIGVEVSVAPPGLALPVHIHRTYDEALYILEGEVTLVIGDRTVTAPAGSFGFAPRGVAHTIRNPGAGPARVLGVTLPASQMRATLEELAALPPEPPDPARVGAILQKYDFESVEAPPDR